MALCSLRLLGVCSSTPSSSNPDSKLTRASSRVEVEHHIRCKRVCSVEGSFQSRCSTILLATCVNGAPKPQFISSAGFGCHTSRAKQLSKGEVISRAVLSLLFPATRILGMTGEDKARHPDESNEYKMAHTMYTSWGGNATKARGNDACT
eukprot:3859697-Pyramimonas_sp.AAC.2